MANILNAKGIKIEINGAKHEANPHTLNLWLKENNGFDQYGNLKWNAIDKLPEI